MKTKFIIMLLIGAIIISAAIQIMYSWRDGYFGGYIEQDTSNKTGAMRLRTFAWKNGEIIHMWSDLMDSIIVHPDIPQTRKKEAKQLLKSLNK